MDPVSIIGSCITLAKAIYELREKIKSDDEGCVKFFKRVDGIRGPLQQLQEMTVETLTARAESLRQINEALMGIDNVLTKRVRNKATLFGKLKNVTSSHFGRFTAVLSELNVELDRCIPALQLAISVDLVNSVQDSTRAVLKDTARIAEGVTDLKAEVKEQLDAAERVTAAVHVDTQTIRDQNEKMSDKLISTAETTAAVHEDTQSIREQLDRLALALQQQASTNALETQFVKDPIPENEYDDRSVLGQGAFGVTHRMVNTADKRVYAVKQVKVKQAMASGLRMEDLLKETQTLHDLNHPHIVRYFTSFFSGKESVFNVVMELIEGGSLAEKICDESVTVVTIGKWLSQMASTLQYLHYEMRTQHRDIKPENIMLTGDGRRIKLIDLGTASVMKTVATKMSRVGTSTYFSYEKANDIPYDGRDDVWAAGCVFAELLTKSRLSDRGGAIHLFTNAAVNDRRVLLISDCVKVDARLGSIIGGMLEAEQEKRCTSEQLEVMLTSVTYCVGKQDNAVVLEVEKNGSTEDKNDNQPDNSPVLENASAEESLSTSNAVERLQSSSPYSLHWELVSSWSFGDSVSAVACSKDRRIAVGGRGSSVHIYDLMDTTSAPLIISDVSEKGVNSICFSLDGSQLAVGSNDRTVKVFDAVTGELVCSSIVKGTVSQVAFSLNAVIASVAHSSFVVVDVPTGATSTTIKEAAHKGICCSSLVANTFVTAGDHKITVFDNLYTRLSMDCNEVSCICITQNASRVFAGTTLGTIQVFGTISGLVEKSFQAHDKEINSLCMGAIELILISGSDDKTVKVWNAITYELMQILEGHSKKVMSVCFGLNYSVVSGSSDETVRVWNVSA